MRQWAGAVVLGLWAVCAGCQGDVEDLGIVARVNGRPIYLSQLEFRHDLMHMEGGGSFVPSVANLRKDYGAILGELIVQELVAQELEARGRGVTDQEISEAEAVVRQDYPDDTFEQMLVEEYIDLGAWRQQLRYHLAIEKFQQQVLRPQIKIDYTEADAYYKKHVSDFYLPERLRLLIVRAPTRELVERAVELYRAERDEKRLSATLKQVATREVTLLEERLSASWKSALRGLSAGQASQVLAEGSGFEALVLLEKRTAEVLKPAQAYPLIEEALLQQKLQSAFDEWLTKALQGASIQISEHLLPRKEAEEPAEQVEDKAEEKPAEEQAPPLPEGGEGRQVSPPAEAK
jgi:hypothetical protein